MATQSDLSKLYSMLTEKTGIERIRDTRLEKIAADRALEMRYQQGLVYNPNNPILHEHAQISARVFGWQTDKGVTENALWHYYPPTWVDHIVGAVDFTFPDDSATYGDLAGQPVGWWNSPVHKGQLMDTRWTHWGHGIAYEDTTLGARRWYFITVFAKPMVDLSTRMITLKANVQHNGYHLTADGKIIHRGWKKYATPTTALVDDRMQVPGKGPMVHLVNTGLKTRWLADDDKIIWGT